jgi:2-iminobutanoate/2-iminopropanoate deaminase
MIAEELLERYAAGERSFQGVDLSGADLSGINLNGVDVSSIDDLVGGFFGKVE